VRKAIVRKTRNNRALHLLASDDINLDYARAKLEMLDKNAERREKPARRALRKPNRMTTSHTEGGSMVNLAAAFTSPQAQPTAAPSAHDWL
jgi:CBS domain containing-hemolysin-like protein